MSMDAATLETIGSLAKKLGELAKIRAKVDEKVYEIANRDSDLGAVLINNNTVISGMLVELTTAISRLANSALEQSRFETWESEFGEGSTDS